MRKMQPVGKKQAAFFVCIFGNLRLKIGERSKKIKIK